MSSQVKEARKKLVDEMMKWWYDGWFNFPEADETINNASRALIVAMVKEHGEAWLGKINLYNNKDRQRPTWKWDEIVWNIENFSASFVLPRDDQVLRDLILERDATEYTGTAGDAPLVEAIHVRIEKIGGETLVWT